MTTYKEIHGTKVEVRDDDPANPVNGQVWYNSQTLKGFKLNPAGSWATGGSLTTLRRMMGSAGTQTSALSFGGVNTTATLGLTESYNGTAFTEVADLNEARRDIRGCGVDNTAALAFGGNNSAKTELWNGSSWTEVNDLGQGRSYHSSAGTTTSAIAFAGNYPPTTNSAITETWNGTSWTEVSNLNTGRHNMAGSGTDNEAALCIGGESPTTGKTESWDGSSWTEVGDLNSGRRSNAGAGTPSASLTFGGNTSTIVNNTEQWDGSSWTEVADLSTARVGHGGSGYSSATTASIAFGGERASGSPSNTAESEEWTAPTETTVSFTVS